MKKIYSLLFAIVLAFVGTASAWAQTEYKSGDEVDVATLQVGDILSNGTIILNASGSFVDYFVNEAAYEKLEFAKWDEISTNHHELSKVYGDKYRVAEVADYGDYCEIYLIGMHENTPEPEKIELTLSENTEISEELRQEIHNKQYDKVTLARTLYADTWSTFTVPFNMTSEQLKANFGDDVAVKSYNGVSVNGENCSLAFKTQTEIHAGVPYMIKTTKDVHSIEVENVTVLVQLQESTRSDNSTTIVFKPVLSKIAYAPSNSYVISNNAFYYVGAALVPIKGYRGYFTIENSALSNMALSFNFEEYEPTDINSTSIDCDINTVYDLQGRRVKSLKQNQLYIQNGRKMIIK